MNKKELMEQLEWLDDDEEIYFAHPSGDYWHHVLVKPAQYFDTMDVKFSAYTETLISVDPDGTDDEELKQVWVLS